MPTDGLFIIREICCQLDIINQKRLILNRFAMATHSLIIAP